MTDNPPLLMLSSAFKGKTVLVTGHTGFKGSWLAAWLQLLGAKVTGISLAPPTDPSHFLAARMGDSMTDLRIDIRDQVALVDAVVGSEPDFVFHLAAQALVRRSYAEPRDTWQTNVIGTLNLLEALRALKKPCAAVLITSDKCYGNVEWVWGYRESDALGGSDPYSASKAGAEMLIRSYIKSFFNEESCMTRIAVARAGNVIGGGDWGHDRIIPDCVRAWSSDMSVELRNPNSTRPWQHVLEPLSGYLALAVELTERSELHGEPFNFGPPAQQNRSVLELVQAMSCYWNQVRWKVTSQLAAAPYESVLLKLNCDKALHYLNWHATMCFEDTVRMTAEWYCAFYNEPASIEAFTLKQISHYCTIASVQGLRWAQ